MSRLLLALAALVLCHAVAAQAWSLSSGGDWSDWGDSSLWGGSDYSSSSSWSSSSWSSGGSSWSSSSWSSGGSSWSSDSFWGSSGSSWSSSSWSSGGSSWSSDSFWGSSGSSSWSSSSWSSGGSSWSSSDDDDDSSSWSSGGWSGGGWSSAWSSSSYASWSSSSLWSSSSGGSSWSTSSWSSGGSSLWSSTSGGSSSSWSTDSFWGSSSGASFWSGGSGSSSDGNSGSGINFDDLWDAVPSYTVPSLGDSWSDPWTGTDVFTPSYTNPYTPTLGDDWGTDIWAPTTYTPIYSWDGGDDAQTYTSPWNPSYTGGGDYTWVDPWTTVDTPSDLWDTYTPTLDWTPALDSYAASSYYRMDWGNYLGAGDYSASNYLANYQALAQAPSYQDLLQNPWTPGTGVGGSGGVTPDLYSSGPTFGGQQSADGSQLASSAASIAAQTVKYTVADVVARRGDAGTACAREVAKYIEAALGHHVEGRPPVREGLTAPAARDYGTFLNNAGYAAVTTAPGTQLADLAQPGDVIIYPPVETSTSKPYGHIQIMDDQGRWVADFVQTDVFAGKSYRDADQTGTLYRAQ